MLKENDCWEYYLYNFMKYKIFKNLIIINVILSITFSVFASNVAVSDGSAFITKAEMAYQLNTISQRMTALENSLDSKIDKLVSSYLTRNGIWNGAKQTMSLNSFKYGFKGGNSIGSYDKSFNIFAYQSASETYNPISIAGGRYPHVVVGANGQQLLVNRISKSGLLFISTGNGTETNQDMRTVPITKLDPVRGDSMINLANTRWVYTCLFDYKLSTDNGSTWKTMNSISTQCVGFGTGTYLSCPSLPVGSVTFFVSKDDKVALNITQQILLEPTTGNNGTTLGNWVSNQESSKTYVIKDMYVY